MASPISAKRARAELPGGRFQAVVRPANYEELLKFFASLDGDSVGAHVRLLETCHIEGPNLTSSAKFSLGMQVLRLSGEDLSADEIPADQLPDAAADAFQAANATGGSFVCLRLSGGSDPERIFVLREPEASRFDSYLKAKSKKAGLDADFAILKQHTLPAFQPALADLQRDAPLGIVALARALAIVGGISLEAVLGEA